MSIEDIKLMGSKVLVKKTPESGIRTELIILPDSVQDQYDSVICEVIKIGPGELFESGYREEVNVKPGDRVIAWGGYGQELDEAKGFYILDVTEIDAIYEN